MSYDDRITFATPEGVDLEIILAGVGSRFVASLIDTAIQTGLVVLLAVISALLGDQGGIGVVIAAFGIVLIFLILFGYHVLFETLAGGRPPGKRWTGLRVVRRDGRPVGFVASVIRNLVRIVDFLPGAYLVGVVSILASRQNQRLGDFAADTLVVLEVSGGRTSRKERRRQNGTNAGDTAALPEDLDRWDVSSVTADELSTVRRFLERRFSLEPQARQRLAEQLAVRLRPRVVGPDDAMPAEPFLEALAAAKAARR